MTYRPGTHRIAGAAALLCALSLGAPVYAEVSDQAAAPIRKLGRGLANTAGGILEIPITIQAVGAEKGPVAGLTLGFLMGAAAAVTRTGVGLIETATFPFPFPGSGYEPILQPEFICEPHH